MNIKNFTVMLIICGMPLAFLVHAASVIIQKPETITQRYTDEIHEVVELLPEIKLPPLNPIPNAYSNSDLTTTIYDPELRCLALNIYFEARGASTMDQIAVTDVVLNRVEDPRYPGSICEVIKQAKLSQWHLNKGREVPLKNQCQFSWYCDGKSDKPREEKSWVAAQTLAHDMLYNQLYRGITQGSTHYHANYVSPYWAKHFTYVSQIGEHVYYKWIL
jgi:spore germination cell wall hydrolase CwlJ-like protein